MKQLFFVSGMPRSGSTLLCNILAQNPKFHATHTSGCLDVLFGVRNNWDKLIEHKAHPDQGSLIRVLKSILTAYHAGIEKPVVFDKSRGWVSYIEMLEILLENKPKILVPIRPVPNVLASFEKLYRETSKVKQPPGEAENYFQFQTIEGRCNFWLHGSQPIGLSINRINDAIQRGHKDKLHFVGFNELTTDPDKKMKQIYEFIGEPYFKHDFDHVDQITQEDDEVYGFVSLHKVRPRVQPMKNDAHEILGKEIVEKLIQIKNIGL